MKKTRKLLALVLAMVMAFSCMVMPAMAHGHEDEGIMPMYEPNPCPMCGKGATYYNRDNGGQPGIWVVCQNVMCGYRGWLS